MNHYFCFVILYIFKYNNVSSIPDANIHIIFYRIRSIVVQRNYFEFSNCVELSKTSIISRSFLHTYTIYIF